MLITSHQSSGTSMAIFKRDEQLTPAMITPNYIREASKSIINASQSVELVRGGMYVPSVRRAVKDLGRKQMEAYIKLELIQLNTLLNLARPMTPMFLDTSVPLILDHLTDEDVEPNLADLKIIFDRARTGFYGQYYGGIGYNDIIGWIDSYILEEKLPAIHAWHEERYRNEDPYERSCGHDRDANRAAQIWNLQRQSGNEPTES